jgi:predicted MFS family arabinose efflux permease
MAEPTMIKRPALPAEFHRRESVQPLPAAGPATALAPVLVPLALLAVGTFAVGTDAFVLSGLLPSMATDLRISISTIGQLITLFAVAYAVAAPLVSALTAGWSRRLLLVLAQVVFIVGMLLQALGTGPGLLAIGRVVAAIGAAAYTTAATAAGAALVAPALRGRAIATVVGGLTAATILGVPLGVFMSHWVGWRGTLLGVAALGAVAAVGVTVLPVISFPVAGLRVRLAVLKRPGVLAVLSVTVAAMSGGFTMYTYLPLLLGPVAQGFNLTIFLLIFGCAGATGNALAGRWTDRIGPLPVLRLGIAAIALVGVLMPFARENVYAAAVAVFIWPCGGWATTVPQQHRLLALGQDVAPVVIGWNASATYAGIALGAVFGGVVLKMNSAVWLGPVGAACAVIALLLTMLPVPTPRA